MFRRESVLLAFIPVHMLCLSSRCVRLARIAWASPVPPMHELSWQIACDENGIDANDDFHFPSIAECPEDNQRHEKINAEPGNIHEGSWWRVGKNNPVRLLRNRHRISGAPRICPVRPATEPLCSSRVRWPAPSVGQHWRISRWHRGIRSNGLTNASASLPPA